MIDNVMIDIQNNLANQNKAPYELIKKRAKNKGKHSINNETFETFRNRSLSN